MCRDGTSKVWLTLLSPDGSVPDGRSEERRTRRRRGPWRCCATGAATPPGVQPDRPLSNPPLNTTDKVDSGVAAFEAAEGGPVPAGLDAVTVNV